MTEEQIKEALRLASAAAGISYEFGYSRCGPDTAGRFEQQIACTDSALETYLRTIGTEPVQNTFPLNPNGASKWAYLQKHDGAEAIGVVFRTESGSVGSLVDGRVVWADWLAHPTGSKPESVNAELLEALKGAKGALEKVIEDCGGCEHEAGVCVCAELSAICRANAAIARAESASETPAKVSPCAGRADQLPDPLGLLSCTHPDCGRYEGPRSHECRAMADNACARPSICQGHAVQQDSDIAKGSTGLQFKCWRCLDTGFIPKAASLPEPPDVKCPNGCLPKKGGA